MNDQQYMQFALQIAASAKGRTTPNPLVGAVLVKEGKIVGFGAHLKAGEPHAEVHAFRMAGAAAEGSTLYVTLEPCSHHGRTPPCAELVAQSGVKRVVVAMEDPNPLVAGRGIARLHAAGITVEVGVLETEARRLNERFLYNITNSLPFVVLKAALTLDGKIATRTNDSRYIAGPEARAVVHQLRNEVDGILVGIGTVLADDPELTTRLPEGGQHPTRIILDSKLRIPEAAKVLQTDVAPTWIVTGEQVDEAKKTRLQARGVEMITLQAGVAEGQVHRLLELLYEKGITHLLVEGGATVNGAFFDSGLVNKYMFFIAPKLVGGAAVATPIGGSGIDKMGDALTLVDVTYEMYGPDLCIVGYPQR